jgi:hypothetical protein
LPGPVNAGRRRNGCGVNRQAGKLHMWNTVEFRCGKLLMVGAGWGGQGGWQVFRKNKKGGNYNKDNRKNYNKKMLLAR